MSSLLQRRRHGGSSVSYFLNLAMSDTSLFAELVGRFRDAALQLPTVSTRTDSVTIGTTLTLLKVTVSTEISTHAAKVLARRRDAGLPSLSLTTVIRASLAQLLTYVVLTEGSAAYGAMTSERRTLYGTDQPWRRRQSTPVKKRKQLAGSIAGATASVLCVDKSLDGEMLLVLSVGELDVVAAVTRLSRVGVLVLLAARPWLAVLSETRDERVVMGGGAVDAVVPRAWLLAAYFQGQNVNYQVAIVQGILSAYEPRMAADRPAPDSVDVVAGRLLRLHPCATDELVLAFYDVVGGMPVTTAMIRDAVAALQYWLVHRASLHLTQLAVAADSYVLGPELVSD
jgi:hypothetical protein